MGLQDRDYMHAAPESASAVPAFFRKSPATWALIGLNVIVFLIQDFFLTGKLGDAVLPHLLLWKPGIEAGYFWTLLTYSGFHAGIFHVLFNCIGLWCAGRFIEQVDGVMRLMAVYWGGAVAGGVCWLALAFAGNVNVPCMGASAGVFALFCYMLLKIPDQLIRLFIFIFPTPPMRAKTAALLLGGFSVLCLLAWEIPLMTNFWPSLPLPPVAGFAGVAHSAHLGGMLWGTGVIIFSKILSTLPSRRREKFRVEPLKQSIAVRPEPEGKPESDKIRQSVAVREPSKDETDRILDKISAYGISSLTPDERRILEQTSIFLKQR